MEEKKAHWAVVFLMQSQRTQHPFLPLQFFPATFFFFFFLTVAHKQILSQAALRDLKLILVVSKPSVVHGLLGQVMCWEQSPFYLFIAYFILFQVPITSSIFVSCSGGAVAVLLCLQVPSLPLSECLQVAVLPLLRQSSCFRANLAGFALLQSVGAHGFPPACRGVWKPQAAGC